MGTAQADAEGRFRVEFPNIPAAQLAGLKVIAAAPGMGFDGDELKAGVTHQETTIALDPEKVVEGRLVNVQGQPAAGVAVHVSSLNVRDRGYQPHDSKEGSRLAVARDDRPGRPVPAARIGRPCGHHPGDRRPAFRAAIARHRGRGRRPGQGEDEDDDDDDRPPAGDRGPGRARGRRQADGRRHGSASGPSGATPTDGARPSGRRPTIGAACGSTPGPAMRTRSSLTLPTDSLTCPASRT